jgi:hypothetical protein
MLARTSSFLGTILPREGLRCVVVLGGPKLVQRFFQTNEQAAAFALNQPNEVYHACSTFKDASSRKVANVHSIKALWLDVDCGIGKPYHDLRGALAALQSFLRSTGLPEPCIAGSGRGLHLYWPLRDSLLPHEWLGYARGLKAQCKLHGFKADPARTCDAASILRPVGTFNRKNPDDVREVCWGGPRGPYEIGAFEPLANHHATGGAGLGVRPAYLPRGGAFDWGAAKRVGEYETTPPDANEVANRCAQVAACRATRGKLPEPLWRACLGVVVRCDSGVSHAHEWSKGDARYDPDETQGKLDRLLKLSGPTTCKTFQSLNPTGCKECRYALEVSTPLELGRQPFVVPVTNARPGLPGGPSGDMVPVAHPSGFVCDETGLWYASEDKSGKQIAKYVSRTKFHLLRISEVDNEQEGTWYVLRAEHKFDGTRELSLAAGYAHGTQATSRMAALGIPIENSDLFRAYLNAAVAKLRAERKATVTYKQFGWKSGESMFVCGPRTYTKHGVLPSELAGAALDRARHFNLRGSLDGWTGAADMLCAPGCEAQQFAILASAAAPLMRFHAQDEGGAIFSQASRESATGKTTSFDAGQSFWGDKDGLAIGSTATQVARGIILATNCNLPVFFDEASQRDPEELRTFVQVFTDGIDRQRGRTDGLLNQNPLTWQTVLLCGSNVPMLDVLGAAGGSDAMTYRILEVCPQLPAELTSNGEKLRRQLKANSGNAGDRYLKYLGQEAVMKYTQYYLEKYYDEIISLPGFDRKTRFIARLLSAVRVAGEIVKKAGVLHCNPQGMMEWGIRRARQQFEATTMLNGGSAIVNYLNEFHNDILTVKYEGRKNQIILKPAQRELRGRYETESGNLYVALPGFRKWLAGKDYSWAETRAQLERDGLLADIKLVTLTAGTDVPGGQIQCIQLRAAALGFGYDQARQSNVVEMKR